MSQTRVVLWRHGRTQWNAELRWQGQSDIPLDEIGLEQAAAAAVVLAELSPTAIVSSDLIRAHKTAQFLSEHTGLEITLDTRLRETDGGQWEGLTQADIHKDYADSLEAWQQDVSLPAGLTGETRHAVASRVAQAVSEHAHRIGGGTLVVATHGGAARAAIMELLDMPMEYLSAFKVLTNCAWAILDHDDIRNTWRISDYNITALPALPEQHL
ncbi:MAG: hypothetical protein RLZZ426_962 [Actinomycetota bacterium]